MKFINRIHLLHSFLFTWLLLFHLTKPESVGRSAYIVHMEKLLMPKVFVSYQNWYLSIVDSLKFVNPTSFDDQYHQSSQSLLYTYDNALHGFSVVLSLDELKALKKYQGFLWADCSRATTFLSTRTPEFLSLNAPTGLWRTSNYGEDIIIGVIDSGVWPESPSFKDHDMTATNLSKWKGSCEEGEEFKSSMCNLKLIGAKYFNRGLLKHKNGSFQIKMNSSRDTMGHGTFVSTIAAGNFVDGVSYFGYAKGTTKGVAPHAKIASYKVIWDNIYNNIDFMAAMEQAIKDGVDVISLSLNDLEEPMYIDPIARASFSAMEKGVVVVCAAGNEGPSLGTMRNGFPWVITVAAGSIDRWFSGVLTLGNGLRIIGWSTFPGSDWIKDLPLIYKQTLSACNSSELLSTTPNGIIFCEPGSTTNQISAVTDSTIRGAILVADQFNVTETPCQCIIIKVKEAKKVLNYVQSANEPLATMEFQQTIMDIDHAPSVCGFSSRGPSQSYSGILKPDIMAPGLLIVGGWSPNNPGPHWGNFTLLKKQYNVASGTSIACPHVAGVAALLVRAHPKWSPAAIRSAIMTTANPLDNSFNPILDSNSLQPASPLAMGAGHIDPNRAVDPGLIYDASRQDYINLLCSLGYERKYMRKIIKSYYSCLKPSSDLNYPSFIVLYKDYRAVTTKTFERIVTNVGNNSTTTYKAVVMAPKSCEVVVSPNTLVFGKKYEKQYYTLSIRYKGNEDGEISFGSLVWVEENGGHTVRSPIVVSLYMNETFERRT